MRSSIALALLVVLVAGCDDTPGKWSLFVYPDAHDRSKWERTDRFKSMGYCREAGAEAIARQPRPDKAAFECVQTGPPG
jgi:hypothetical protein